MKLKKVLCTLLAIGMMASCFTACTGGSKDSNSSPSPSTSATSSASPSSKPEERVKLSMVSTDAGIKIPEDVDPGNNPFVNIAKEYANADIEYEIIPWADYQTKMNLLLASGKYPDTVHTAYNENITDVESKGAFVNLLPYYENSEIVQKVIDKDFFMEKAKNNTTGEYYYMPMSTSGDGYPDGYWMRARWDLIEKHNNGEWPKNIDEWIELARKVKAANPNATPFSAWCPGTMIFQYNKQFWYAYGVESNLAIVKQKDDTFQFNVQDPDYKRAMELHKQLYDEGLLSQTFATNTDYAMLTNDYNNNDLLVWSDSCQQFSGGASTTWGTDKPWVAAPLLEEYPVDREKAMTYNTKFNKLDTGHRVHISKSCAYPDRAWRFIEGLCSDEMSELIFWGEEGVTYKSEGDERVIIADAFSDPNRTYGTVYGMILGYGNSRVPNLQALKNSDKIKNPAFIDMELKNEEAIGAEAKPAPGSEYMLGDLLSDDVSAKMDEAQGVVTSLAVKYIMGRITMEDYDKGIADFLTKYGFILEEYTNAYKARYIDKTA
jgi:putative aldouronate transport system substrate-binding protein